MRARHFFTLLLLILAISTVHATPEQTYSRPVEIRAVWMDHGSVSNGEDNIRALIRKYAKAGINVIHPEVIYNGYSAYPSSYLTQKDTWDGIDMLSILIDEAHKQGIEVHPWVRVFRVGHTNDIGGILKEHPNWIAVNKNGETLSANGGYWLCPSIPAVRKFLLGAIRELAQKYAIDGIELDYIRFENQNPTPYCYNESCRTKFKAEYGIDPMDIQPFTTPVVDWHLWRENLINTFVAEVNAEVKKVRPNAQISAAVGSLPDQARLDLLQNWEHWAANKWVDFLAPMVYTSDTGYFGKAIDNEHKTLQNRALLSPGIGLYIFKEAEPMLEQVKIARSEPVDGVNLFASAYLDENRLKALETGPFSKPAKVPFRSPIDGAKRLVSSAREKMKEGASSGDIAQASLEIKSAQNLIEYASYRMKEIGYVEPEPPSIFIPAEVIPIPEAHVPFGTSAPVIDGKLDDAVWQRAIKVMLNYTNLGEEALQPTEVYLVSDTQNLYIAYRSYENKMNQIKAKSTEHDGPVFYDDSVEFFLDIQGATTDYFHFAMNTAGVKYEAHVFDAKYNPEWQGSVEKGTDAWAAEMSIPLSALNVTAPIQGTWRANFCRNRAANTEIQYICWSPTYGSFHTPIRFGKLTFVDK